MSTATQTSSDPTALPIKDVAFVASVDVQKLTSDEAELLTCAVAPRRHASTTRPLNTLAAAPINQPSTARAGATMARKKPLVRRFTITVRGKTETDLESSWAEANRLIKEGYLSGGNCNESSGFYFDSTDQIPKGEVPA